MKVKKELFISICIIFNNSMISNLKHNNKKKKNILLPHIKQHKLCQKIYI